jgi:hypothetical protein
MGVSNDGKIKSALDHQGYAILTDIAEIPDESLLKTVRMRLQSMHAPRGSGSPYDRIFVRWQRQINPTHATSEQLRNEQPDNKRPWLITDAKNCDRAALEYFSRENPLFTEAEDFFSALSRQLHVETLGPDHLLIQEIRYSDPMGNASIADTHWHTDQPPTYLTATASWMGPGTVLLPANDPIMRIGYPTRVGQLKGASGDQLPEGAVLVFYGQAGAEAPLWHRSPETVQPRLLLIHRLVNASEAVSIRPALN